MKRKERARRSRYAIAAAGTALFGAVYECFSHQVYSKAMIFAFLIPLLGGALPGLLLERLPARQRPGGPSRWLWGAGLTVLTAGSLFRGVLEIYGTTSRLSAVYPMLGWTLLALRGAAWALELHSRREDAPSYEK